jgi:hypothetical protein
VKKFLLVLVVLGVAAAIAYLLFSRRREIEVGTEPEIDLRETTSEPAESGAAVAHVNGSAMASWDTSI